MIDQSQLPALLAALKGRSPTVPTPMGQSAMGSNPSANPNLNVGPGLMNPTFQNAINGPPANPNLNVGPGLMNPSFSSVANAPANPNANAYVKQGFSSFGNQPPPPSMGNANANLDVGPGLAGLSNLS